MPLLPSMFIFLMQQSFAVPQQFTQQGRIMDSSGAPITGIHTITVRIYDSAAGGQMLWDESQQTLLNNGFYSVFLGANSAIMMVHYHLVLRLCLFLMLGRQRQLLKWMVVL